MYNHTVLRILIVINRRRTNIPPALHRQEGRTKIQRLLLQRGKAKVRLELVNLTIIVLA